VLCEVSTSGLRAPRAGGVVVASRRFRARAAAGVARCSGLAESLAVPQEGADVQRADADGGDADGGDGWESNPPATDAAAHRF
jgi:hypothetical protein